MRVRKPGIRTSLRPVFLTKTLVERQVFRGYPQAVGLGGAAVQTALPPFTCHGRGLGVAHCALLGLSVVCEQILAGTR